MNLNSKKTSLIILGITALTFSRVMFSLFNDPEGPNLLIVIVMAAILYFLSLAAYLYSPLKKQSGYVRIFLTIFIQAIFAAAFYFWLN
jgi:hypothetical protein